MKKRLMTLADLYNYYSSTASSVHFSSKDDDSIIAIRVDGELSFEESKDDGLMPVTLHACHTLGNVNGTFISNETMENALRSLQNKPILGFIHEVDGEPEFWRHNRHMNEDGEIIYDEIPVGTIPESCDAHLEYDDNQSVDFVVCKGYIYEIYTNAADILRKNGKHWVSVEIFVKELSYNAEEKLLEIKDFDFNGVTILGKNPDGSEVQPGMEGSNIVVGFDASQNLQEGGNADMPIKFEEMLEKYGVTVEDIDFEYAEMTDEELATKFEEVFGGAEDDSSNPDSGDNFTVEPEPTEENYQKIFEISHEDIRHALYMLLEPIESADNCYYWISNVYDDYFVYENYDGTKVYGQKYAKDDTNVSFVDERYALHRELLTDSEYVKLKEMRENYDSVIDKLSKFESEPDKIAILQSADYEQIAETEQFQELLKQENHFDLTVDEVTAKADELLLAYAKGTKLEFSQQETVGKDVGCKKLPINKKKASRYGTIFAK